jgi:RNA polymerase sigma factor (sigma-70 family)
MAAVPYEGHAAAAPFRLTQPEGEATRLLYERHHRKILAFCQHQLRNREEAEDATQITFMNAFRGLKRGTSPEFESAWLYKIAHNVCVSKQRISYRRRLVEAPSDFELIEELVPAHEGDSDELFGLTSALRVLPEQQRRALLLREWQGLSYREIADELRLSQAAVETLLFRARRSLAEALTTDPSQRRGPGRPRMASNAGSLAAALKSLLLGGGVKAAATAATVAATSVVAATPAARHDLMGAVMRSDAADRPVPASPVHTSRPAFSTSPAVVRLVWAAAVHPPVTPHASAKKPVATRAVAPAIHLPLVAAPRIVEPVAPHHEPVPSAPTPAPAPAAAAQPVAVAEPVPADAPAPAPAADVATPVVVPAPPPVEESRVAPAQAKRSPAAPSPAPPVQTVTVESVIQPTTDPVPAAADPAAAPTPAWVPPGQAKRDQGPADSANATATPASAPAPAVTTTDAAPDSGTAWVPPGQAKKADDASPGDDNRVQGKSKDR